MTADLREPPSVRPWVYVSFSLVRALIGGAAQGAEGGHDKAEQQVCECVGVVVLLLLVVIAKTLRTSSPQQ